MEISIPKTCSACMRKADIIARQDRAMAKMARGLDHAVTLHKTSIDCGRHDLDLCPMIPEPCHRHVYDRVAKDHDQARAELAETIQERDSNGDLYHEQLEIVQRLTAELAALENVRDRPTWILLQEATARANTLTMERDSLAKRVKTLREMRDSLRRDNTNMHGQLGLRHMRIVKLQDALEGAKANTVLLQQAANTLYVEDGYAIEDIDSALTPPTKGAGT